MATSPWRCSRSARRWSSETLDGEKAEDLEAFLADGPKRGGIVRAVRFAAPPEGAFRYLKVTRKHPHGASVLSIAAVLPVTGGKISGARVAYGAMAAKPMRAMAVEAALDGTVLDEAAIARRRQGGGGGYGAGGRSAGERLVPDRRCCRCISAGCLSGRRRADGQGPCHLHRQRRRAGRVRRGERAARRRAPRQARAHRHAHRLRPGHLRRLHRAHRRRAGALLPHARSAGERRRGRDGRGHRHRRRAPPAAARLRRRLRRAVRLLHVGHDRRRQGAARPQSRSRPGRGDRRDLRQYLPLHRLRADHQRHPRRRRRHARREDRPEGDTRGTRPGILRRRAQGRRQGGRHQPRTLRCARPCHRPHPVLRRPAVPGHAPSPHGAEPARSCAHSLRRHVGGGEDARRGPGHHPQGRAGQHLHHPPPDPGRAERRAGACRGQGAVQGRAGRRGPRRERGDRPRGGGEGQDRLRGAAGGPRRRGGAEARRAAGQRVPRPQLVHLRGPPLPARPPRRRGEGLRRGRSHPRGTLPVLADRACAGRDHGLHRRAGSERAAHLLLEHPGAVLHPRQCRA